MAAGGRSNRRRVVLLAAGGLVLGPLSSRLRGADVPSPGSIKIGIIGTGNIGGTLAELWAKAGHELLISSRHPGELQDLAGRLGPKVRAGTPRDAAAFGEVILVSAPYGAFPQIGRDFSAELRGKVVLDPGNPYPSRDGDMAYEARKKGTGVADPQFFPGVRLVRAFNSLPYWELKSEAHRAGEKAAIPLAADDADALKIAERLVRDAGFEPVVVGGLSRAREFDVGTAVYGRAHTARELRKALGLPQ